MNNKIVSYIHFSIKKGAVKFGLDDVIKIPRKVKLIIYSSELQPSSLSKLISVGDENSIKCISLTEELKATLLQKNVKVIGITDESLAKAILNNINN